MRPSRVLRFRSTRRANEVRTRSRARASTRGSLFGVLSQVPQDHPRRYRRRRRTQLTSGREGLRLPRLPLAGRRHCAAVLGCERAFLDRGGFGGSAGRGGTEVWSSSAAAAVLSDAVHLGRPARLFPLDHETREDNRSGRAHIRRWQWVKPRACAGHGTASADHARSSASSAV